MKAGSEPFAISLPQSRRSCEWLLSLSLPHGESPFERREARGEEETEERRAKKARYDSVFSILSHLSDELRRKELDELDNQRKTREFEREKRRLTAPPNFPPSIHFSFVFISAPRAIRHMPLFIVRKEREEQFGELSPLPNPSKLAMVFLLSSPRLRMNCLSFIFLSLFV